MERKRGRVGSTLVSRGDSECSSERRPCTTREQERYTHTYTQRKRSSTKHKGWEAEALHVRAREHVCVVRVLVVCLRECARARWESHLKPSRLCQRYMGPKCERSCTRVSSQGERDEDAPPAQVDLRGQDRGFREFQA